MRLSARRAGSPEIGQRIAGGEGGIDSLRSGLRPKPPLSRRFAHIRSSSLRSCPTERGASIFGGRAKNGGEGGIRTLGTLASTHDFQSCTLDHSVTSPETRPAFHEPRRLVARGQIERKASARVKGLIQQRASECHSSRPSALWNLAECEERRHLESQGAQENRLRRLSISTTESPVRRG